MRLRTGTPEPLVIGDVTFCTVGRQLSLRLAIAFLLSVVLVICAHGREKDVLQYGAGLIVNVPFPEAEVAQVVEEVAQNTIIRGTKEYNKDEFITGANEAKSTPVFPAWREGGKVFYKVRQHALNPLNFKNSNDVGTLAVRYVVQPQGDKNTVLRVDALFVEDFRHAVHQSNGSVESSEYKDIQDRLQAVELMKKENAEAEQAKQERLAKKSFGMGDDSVLLSTPPSTAAQTSPALPASATPQPSAAYEQQPPDSLAPESLEQHVAELRQQVERLGQKPGAPRT